MFCPVCSKEMTLQDLGGVHVDICINGCKGMWLDWLELEKLDEMNEGFGQALQRAQQYPRYNDTEREQLKCPKCATPMHAHQFHSIKKVNIDECYACGGFFLDSGELKIIRDTHMNEDERKKYVQDLLLKQDPYQKSLVDQSKQELRTRAIQKYTRKLRVSYYMTGK